jgi:hypothetical protein
MGNLNFSEAFASYGAKLVNPQWAVSAMAEDGAFVMSCWAHYFTKVDDVLRYEDTLSRWSGNAAGNNLLRKHVEDACKNGRPVRLLIAQTKETDAVDSGHDASKVKKSFHVRPDLTGRVTHFDGDRLVIDFQKEES